MFTVFTKASIARTAILLVAGVVTLFAAAAVVVMTQLNQYRTTESLLEKAALISRIVTPNAASMAWNYDPQGANQLLRSLSSDPDFETGLLATDHALPFARYERAGADEKIRSSVKVISKLISEISDGGAGRDSPSTYVLPDRVVVISAMNYAESNRFLGYLALSFTRARASDAVRREGLAITAGGVIMLGLICGLLGTILSRVTRPIREITAVMGRLSKGEIDAPLPATGRRDEIGAMARALAVFRGFAYRATHDALTDLPNRALLYERLDQALAAARPRFALLLLDLDHFKDINDQLGHAAGDELLKLFAARLCSCVGPADTVARLGGDEFCIVQHGADDHPAIEATALANRIVELMAEPVELEGRPVVVGTSVGIAIAPEHGESTGLLLRRADNALYVAKHEGRCGYCLYSPDPELSIAPACGSVTARFDARSVAA